MSYLIALVLALDPAPADVEAFRATDAHDLTLESASTHLAAARYAGMTFGVRPELLLAIAWHESRYTIGVVTREPGHRVSCGAMTPTPQRRCSKWELSALGGYLAGARHLRAWLDHCGGSEWCALTSYAGGSGLVRVCAKTGRWTAPSGHNACDVAGIERYRARTIARAIGGAS